MPIALETRSPASVHSASSSRKSASALPALATSRRTVGCAVRCASTSGRVRCRASDAPRRTLAANSLERPWRHGHLRTSRPACATRTRRRDRLPPRGVRRSARHSRRPHPGHVPGSCRRAVDAAGTVSDLSCDSYATVRISGCRNTYSLVAVNVTWSISSASIRSATSQFAASGQTSRVEPRTDHRRSVEGLFRQAG